MARIKGAIFDLDGTLFDSLWVWGEIDKRFLSGRGIDVPPDYAAAVSTMNFFRCAEYTIERFGLSETPDALVAEWLDMAKDVYAHEIGLKKGAAELLARLDKRGVKLAVATSSNRDLYLPALKNNGIFGLFDFIADTSDTRGKDFPDVYLKAAKGLGLAPGECLVFEDLPAALVSAKKGGFTTVGVSDRHMTPTSEQKKAFDYFVSDLGQFDALFPFDE